MSLLQSLLRSVILAAVLVGLPGSAPAQVACDSLLTSDTTLTEDLTCTGNGLRIGSNGVTLDCGGHEIRGPLVFGTAGVLVSGVSGVTIVGCRVDGFGTNIRAENAPDLRVASSVLSGVGGGVRCTGCPRAVIEENRIEGHLGPIHLIESPDSRITANEMRPYVKGGGSFVLRSSPRARISGNRAPEGGAGALLDDCDDSVIEDNEIARNATIWLYRSDRCRILRNSLVRGTAGPPNSGGFVHVTGGSDNLIASNEIEGALGVFLTAGPPGFPEESPYDGADHNVVEDNWIHDSGFGVLVFGASANQISGNTIERTEAGLGIYGLIDPTSDYDAPSDDNIVANNRILGGLFGAGTWRASGNRFSDNEITGHWIGVFEGPVGPFSPEPNEYDGNLMAGHRIVGLLLLGSSALVAGNVFEENGSQEPARADLEPWITLLGEARGAIALLPVAGDDFTLDNGDPGDDWLAGPVIGRPSAKNLFSGTTGIDIYALDTRAANAESLERDNQFRGEGSTRIRQDWFGLVHVVSPEGPEADAVVDVRDASGEVVASFTTGSSGFGPPTADPSRSQGLGGLEDGGPVPPWPRFTQFTIDDRGRRRDHTSHSITAEAAGLSGCGTYAWDGLPDGAGSTSADGRYQVAVVRLGLECPAGESRTEPPRP